MDTPRRPHLIVDVITPNTTLRRFFIPPFGSAKVGRTSLSDFVIAEDESLSGAHFLIEWDGELATLRDLESAAGTRINGAKVEWGTAGHGAWLRAGTTDFRLYEEGYSLRKKAKNEAAERESQEPNEIATASAFAIFNATLCGLLNSNGPSPGNPLRIFALLDAARSPLIVPLLKESLEPHQSLFDGMPGAALWRVAPYLVELGGADGLANGSPAQSLLSRLFSMGYGNSFGIYVISSAPLKHLRQHFRRHLRAIDPNNRSLYFRLYDPRVLRRFLPMASERQLAELFAEVSAFVMEGASPRQAHVFSMGAPAPKIEVPPQSATGHPPNVALSHQIFRLESSTP